MLGFAVVYLLMGVGLVLAWYSWFLHVNRKKSLEVLRWLEMALAGKGHVVGIRWLAPSRFHVPLRLGGHQFQHASVVVELMPREMPMAWVVRRFRKQPETVTFQADLDVPPASSLEVHTHRWCGRTRKNFSPDPRHWTFDQSAPFVLTTRGDWQREVTAMMNSFIGTRERELLAVSFQRSSPHFSATVPLECLSPEKEEPVRVFEVLHEIAAGISPSHF